MRKNIVIGVLAVITVLSIGYGYFQKREADRCIILAEQLATKAEMFSKEAEMKRLTAQFQMRKAEEARNESEVAIRQLELTLKQLQMEKNNAEEALKESNKSSK